MEKRLIRDLQQGISSTVKRGSDRAVQVIQLDVNPHKPGRIVRCRIVCNIFSEFVIAYNIFSGKKLF